MKKMVCMCLVIVILCLFVSCHEEFVMPQDSEKNSESLFAQETDDQIVNEEPLQDHVFSFNTYDDLVDALIKGNDQIFTNSVDYGAVYRATISSISTQKNKILIPRVGSKAIGLRNKNGYDNITFFTNELYHLPWIWYHCVVDGYDLSVRIAYPNVLSTQKLNTADTYLNALSVISPNAPMPVNLQKYESYKNIYEEKITLAKDTVTALIYEMKDSSKLYVSYYQNGAFVVLYADANLFTDAFWSSFQMVEYTNP